MCVCPMMLCTFLLILFFFSLKQNYVVRYPPPNPITVWLIASRVAYQSLTEFVSFYDSIDIWYYYFLVILLRMVPFSRPLIFWLLFCLTSAPHNNPWKLWVTRKHMTKLVCLAECSSFKKGVTLCLPFAFHSHELDSSVAP